MSSKPTESVFWPFIYWILKIWLKLLSFYKGWKNWNGLLLFRKTIWKSLKDLHWFIRLLLMNGDRTTSKNQRSVYSDPASQHSFPNYVLVNRPALDRPTIVSSRWTLQFPLKTQGSSLQLRYNPDLASDGFYQRPCQSNCKQLEATTAYREKNTTAFT